MIGLSANVDLPLLAHLLAFGTAAVACFASAARARRIGDPDTRRGLFALLALSGSWATAHVAYLLAPTAWLAVAFYQGGLLVGFATVGPWLYFCSAYTARSLHRNPSVRRAAVVVFLAVAAVKLTNSLHGLYFTATVAREPFPHVGIVPGVAHWLAMGLAYGLAMVGYFLLLERFLAVSYDTRPLLALAGVTALPLVLDIAGTRSPLLVDITYEPLGVAVFALGATFVYLDRFRTVRVAGAHDDPAVVLDEDDRIREYNDSAAALFPALAEGQVIDEPLWRVLPDVADAFGRDADAPVVALDRDGETRYYQLSETPFTAGGARLGRLLAVTDVTDRERYRRELERQNERLETFASMVSHDLRNPLAVAMGRLDIAREERDGDDEHLAAAATALDRMEALIEDVLALARQGQPIDEPERVALSAVAERTWRVVETADAELRVEGDLAFLADPDRLQQLLENLFRNSVEHGSTGSRPSADDSVEHGSTGSRTGSGDSVEHGGAAVTIRVGPLDGGTGFYVADDGPGIPPEEREEVFASGYSTAEEGTGFGLAIVREIADAHGWTIDATDSADGGARFEITGVDRAAGADE